MHNYLNNKLIVLSIISVLISIVYCKNQYVYTFKNENSNFKVIDIENNKQLINQVLPVGDLKIAIQYVYNETTNFQPGSKFPILSLFAERIEIENNTYKIYYFTIDYNIDSNTFLNNGTQIPYTLDYDFSVEYESTPYSLTKSNLYLPIQVSSFPVNKSLIIFNWDLEKEKFKALNYSEISGVYGIPHGAMNQTSSLYYILFVDENSESEIQAIDYSNGKSNGETVGVFKFNINVLNYFTTGEIYVTNSGSLIAIKLNATHLSISTINLQQLSCQEVFSFEIGTLNNNFNIYNFDSPGEYMIISNGAVAHAKIIEYYYVNLSTFKIDFAYKTSNYYNSRPDYYYY